MELLHWKQENLTARKFTINGEDGQVGMLVFRGWASNDADFTSERINLHFQRQGWLEHDVTISFKGEVVGMSKTYRFGETTTTLVTGEQYTLAGKSLSSTRDLVDAAGNTVMRFEQGDYSIMEGNISISSDVPELTKLLLVAIGLYFKNLGK